MWPWPLVSSYRTGVSLQPGLAGRAFVEVEFSDSAASLGSGDIPVLGTPRVVALVEEATVSAVADHLEDGQTTVGTRIELAHNAPTPSVDRCEPRPNSPKSMVGHLCSLL